MDTHALNARHEAFLAAAKSGELEAVKSYFELPEVLENVAVWNTFYRARPLGAGIHAVNQSDLPAPWFRVIQHGETLFTSSIVPGGQVEVLKWFFLQEQIPLLGDTLRVIVRDIARSCLFPVTSAAFHMVEIIIESPLFAEIMEDDERDSLLGSLLNDAASRGLAAWVAILVGYGADPNKENNHRTPLAALGQHGDTKTLDELLAHGAWLLECETSLIASGHLDWNEQLIGDLLRRGADANFVPSNHGSLLHRVIYDGVHHILYPLILKGFADVDVRDTRGRTPLTVLATRAEGFCDMWSRTGIAELLLKHGADIHALDYRGRSMLHYAMCESTLENVRFFLARGLNPNHQDAAGTAPLIALLLHARHDIRGYVIEWLDMMLQTGADPFVRDDSGVSAAKLLESSPSGQAYIQSRRPFFRQQP